MSNLRQIFSDGIKPYKRNFIQENVKDVRKIQTLYRSQEFQPELPVQTRFNKSHIMEPQVETILKPKFGERCTIATTNTRINQLAQPKSVPKSYPQPLTPAQAVKHMSVPRINGNRNRMNFKNLKRDDREIIQKGDVAEFVRRQRERNIGELEEITTMSEGSSVACGSGYSSEVNSIGRNPRHGRDKGVQTLDEDGIARLYQNGMVLYPSTKLTKLRKEMRKPGCNGSTNTAIPEKSFGQNSNLPEAGDSIVLRNDNLSIPELGNVYQNFEGTKKPSGLPMQAGKDYVKMNALSVGSLYKSPEPIVDPLKAPATYQKGVLPKYMRDRQGSWHQKEPIVSSPDLVCPPGYITIPEEERLQTQKVLRESYDERIKELNMMPVRTDTLKMRHKKAQLEEELNKIEDGIKVFSKPRVFVKMSE